jgi:hypothetical protein
VTERFAEGITAEEKSHCLKPTCENSNDEISNDETRFPSSGGSGW